MRPSCLLLSLVVLVSAPLLIADADAQIGGARAGRGNAPSGNRQNRAERALPSSAASSSELIEYRLSLLEEDLKLTAEQGKAWQVFAGSVRAHAGDLARERARDARMSPSSATPVKGLQHIAQAVDGARNRLAALEEVESSGRALYQSLSAGQKALADLRIPSIISPRPVPAAGSAPGNLPSGMK